MRQAVTSSARGRGCWEERIKSALLAIVRHDGGGVSRKV